MKNIRNPYAPAIAWGIFVFVLSVWPGKDFPKIPEWGDLLAVDKIIHTLFYALLTLLIIRGKRLILNNLSPVPILFAFGAALFSISMGFFLEWVQGTFCEDRMADVMDGLANSIGAVLSLIGFLIFQKRRVVTHDH